MLITENVPSPLESATGMENHGDVPGPGSAARSVRLSLLKSPVTTWAPGVADWLAKPATGAFVT